MRSYIAFTLNGKLTKAFGDEASMTLSNYLRRQRHLVGTKVVCAEGDCGSCTVLIKRDADRFRTINSCITLMAQLDGAHLVTVEALNQSEVQKSLATHHGSQCGFCTPGFVMSLTGLCEKSLSFDQKDVKNHCTGNLCRCTGYQDIIAGALAIDTDSYMPLTESLDLASLEEPLQNHTKRPAHISGEATELYLPNTLSEALKLKKSLNEATLWAGGTDLGVQLNKDRLELGTVIHLGHVKELKKLEVHETPSKTIVCGSNTTLQQLETTAEPHIPELSRYLRRFASPQIKHSATLAGNLVNASPIGDSMPPLLALGATLQLTSTQGSRPMPLADFYQGYRKTNLRPDEIVEHVRIPIPDEHDFFRCYKVSKRMDLDISSVAAAFKFRIQDGLIQEARIAFGGMAATPLRLPKEEASLVGQPLCSATMESLQNALDQGLNPLSDHRGSSNYRMLLAKNLVQRFFNEAIEFSQKRCP